MKNLESLIAAGALAAALSAAPQPARSQPASQDARELKAYVLTMDVINKIAKANKAALAAAAKDPKRQALSRKKAELESLEAKEAPTDAEQERMMALADEIARASESDDTDHSNGTTIAEYARKVETTPSAADAVKSAGLSSREYATATLALLQASITWELIKTKMIKQAPADVSAANVEFMRVHEKEIAALEVLPKEDSR